MANDRLTLAADERTEDLLGSILDEIDDDTLDQLEVEREIVKQSGLTAEPATAAATIVAATPIVIAVLRVLKSYLEGRNAIQRGTLVLQAQERGGQELAESVAETTRIAPPGWSVEIGPLKAEMRQPD